MLEFIASIPWKPVSVLVFVLIFIVTICHLFERACERLSVPDRYPEPEQEGWLGTMDFLRAFFGRGS